MFNRFGHINDQLREVAAAKSEIDYKGPIFLGFAVRQIENIEALLHFCSQILAIPKSMRRLNGIQLLF